MTASRLRSWPVVKKAMGAAVISAVMAGVLASAGTASVSLAAANETARVASRLRPEVAMPPAPPLCKIEVSFLYPYQNNDVGCLVSSYFGPDAGSAQHEVRAGGLMSISAPSVIHIGQPFTISVGAPYPPCGGKSAPGAVCVASWYTSLRAVDSSAILATTIGGAGRLSSLAFPPTMVQGPHACDGSDIGITGGHQVGNPTLSCPAEILNSSTAPGFDPEGQWWALGVGIDYFGNMEGELEVPVEVVGKLTQPVASFEVNDFSGTHPGEFQFVSTSQVPGGDSISSYRWEFGDSAAGEGATAGHTYTKPGTYPVRLTITDVHGRTDSTVQEVVVKPPQLSIGVGFPGYHGERPNPDPGQTVPVSLTVSAGNGVGDLKDLRFDGGPLEFSSTKVLSIASGPDPDIPSPLELAPGDSHTYVFQVSARALGVTKIDTTMTGKDSAGGPVEADDETALQVGQDLKVELSATPSATVKVDDDEDGKPVPAPFDIVVAVTNPYNVALADVRLDDTPVLDLLDAAIAKDPHILEEDPNKPAPSLVIGGLAPGETRKVTVPFLALDDGREKVTWGASGVDPTTGNGVKGNGKLTVHVNPKYLVSIEVKSVDAGTFVTSGDSFGLDVDLVDVSNSARVKIDAMTPEISGNAAGANPFDVDDPPDPVSIPAPGGVAGGGTAGGGAQPLGPCDKPSVGAAATTNQAVYYLPWEGKLGPGDPMNLAANVYTVPGGGTRGTITYKVTGTATLDDGTTEPLDADNVVIIDDDGDQQSGNVDTFQQSVNDSVAPPPPSSTGTVAWNFTVGSAIGAALWWCGTFRAVGALAGLVNPFSSEKALALYQAVEYGLTWYQNLTPDQKADWLSWAAEDLAEQTKQSYDQAYAAVSSQALAWWQKGIDAWNSGDDNALAEWLGEASSTAALEISSWFVGTVWSRSVVSLEERAKVAGLATEAAAGGSKAATKLQVGVNLLQDDPSLVESVYGLTDAQAANVSALAKDENALIAVRSRNPQSIEAEQLWGAFNKPASIKMKSVDQVDVDLLGYPKTVTVNGVSGPSEGLVVWRDPAQSAAYLAAHSAGVDPVLLQAAESRLALRTTEWQKYQASLAHYVQDGLPVEFNYAANGLSTTEPMPGYNLRQFKLKPVGDGTYLPLVMNNSRALVPITGDVDVVAVTSTNGTLLTPQQRLTIYQSLQSADGVGMQHGETLSWLTGGEGQVKLLTDHVGENAERLLVFDPVGGARTATIDAAHTTFTAKDNSLNGVWYIGAYKTPFASAFQNVVVTLQQANELVTPYIGPTSWWLTGPGAANSGPPPTGNNNGQLGGCDWEFSSGGVTLQPGGNGGLQQYVNGQWQTYQPPAACTSGSGSDIPRTGALGKAIIEVAPQSALLYGATPGSRRISLIPLAFVDPYVKAKDTAWFAPGETIMLDPGGGDQEAATIARVAGSTVTLSKPLQFGHAGGEMVTVLARPHGGRRSQGAYVPALLMPLVPVCRRRRSKRGRVALRPLSRGHKLVAGERTYR